MKSFAPMQWLADRSIFFKTLIVILIAALLVNLVVGVVFRSIMKQPRGRLVHFIQGYTEFVIQELGAPPSLERAMQFVDDFGLNIYFVGPEDQWATTGLMSDLDNIRFSRFHSGLGVDYGRVGHRLFFRASRSNGDYYFSPDFTIDDPQHEIWVLLLILMLSAVFIAVFILLRYLFRQIYVLQRGVWEVSQGNLNHKLKVPNTDELGELSIAFNHMTDQVKKQLHSKEQLLLNVSHELRSPLTRMKLAIEFIPEEKTKQRLSTEVAAMDGMLEELLESARLDHEHGVLKYGSVKLDELILACMEEVIPDPAQASFIPPQPGITLKIDEKRIYSLIKNLLENALKYSDAANNPLELNLVREGDYCRFYVQDFGEGIPPDDLAHIFEAFYRVDKSRNQKTGGYGLGLALCKKIALAHGGTLEASSTLGEGTRFTLNLPLKPQAPGEY